MHFEDAIKLILSVLVFTAPQGVGDLLKRVDKRTGTIVRRIDLQIPMSAPSTLARGPKAHSTPKEDIFIGTYSQRLLEGYQQSASTLCIQIPDCRCVFGG